MTATPSPLTPAVQSWLWRPNIIVFVSNFCIMVLELVAGRIIAPYVGVSLYTWTSVIGIVLAGISLGNYLGGVLADRRASLRLLGGVFLAGGFFSLIILSARLWFGLIPSDWPVIPQILLLVTILFFGPSTILGMTSPIVAKMAVRDLNKTGVTVGKIYAAGTVGSIAGTFATGFVLISRFGTHAIVWGVAAVIIGLGILFLSGGRTVVALLVLVGAVGSTLGAASAGWLDGPCLRETNYFCIRIIADERDGEPVRKLVLDRLVHSFNSLENPLALTYDYEHMYAELTAYQAQQRGDISALFIGGGGYTFPRYMETLYPQARLDVIEIDPGVTAVAFAHMGLSPDTAIRSFNQDARLYLRDAPSAQYKLIFGDAFNDFSVPYHLTTREFNELVAAWLADDGVYVVNLIDGAQATFLRAYVATLQETFAHVYLAPTLATWRDVSHSTFVVVASAVPLDLNELAQVALPDATTLFVDGVMDSAEFTTFLNERPTTLLTDRFAPVEQMLAPAFRGDVAP